MTELIRLYLRNIFFGFLLALTFVTLLMVLNVGGLWDLIGNSDIGLLAVAMLLLFNTLLFSGVQFAIAVMRMAGRDTPRGPGRRSPARSMPLGYGKMTPVKVAATSRRT
ncbi:hypothetical protein [Phaeovulum sp. W22_SRMD_FR3]|uniref:hypothetical protein n=1 Tax=Phaeovulum sp. W22_SRMD_FR3 TaxID=3240274 RepID=UPI003F967320